MAVWGAPTAHEDDAERAVRAGLELVDAIRVLGPGIEARAGVLTGEAAVTLGATNQGLVAGDLVNTAARLQSAAAPGTVLVGEATRRAASRGHRLRARRRAGAQGQGEPGPGLRARCGSSPSGAGAVAARRWRPRSSAATTSCGCSRTCYHATAREQRTRLVSVSGPAGIGKSRLAWEFLKYVDGLVEQVWWHDGRSPAYGDGISFWALGEMIRARAGLLEGDDEATTRARVARDARDPHPRRVRAPLAGARDARAAGHRGGRAQRAAVRRVADLLRAARGERTRRPRVRGLPPRGHRAPRLRRRARRLVALVADPRRHPRPPGAARAPPRLGRRRSAASRRSTSSRSPSRRCASSSRASCPGLPEAAVRPIVARADGIPLYAVETVRMLLADGRLEQRDGPGAASR